MTSEQERKDFALACNWLIDNGQLPVTGERQIDTSVLKVYDQTAPGIENQIDITPSQQVLTAALASAALEVSRQSEIDQARAAIASGVIYIQRQLILSNGDTLTGQIAVVRPAVVANMHLTNAMTKMLGLLKLANGWTPTVAVLLNPTNDTDRARYLKAVVLVVASLRT